MRWKGCGAVFAVLVFGALACNANPLSAAEPTDTATPFPSSPSGPAPKWTRTRSPQATRTASPTVIPGIEESVRVGDAVVTVANALRREVFRCQGESQSLQRPESEIFLVVLLQIKDGPVLTQAGALDWIGANGIDDILARSSRRPSIPQAFICVLRNSDTQAVKQIDLAFVVDRDAEGLALVLPDGTEIPLDSFSVNPTD